VGRRRRGGAAVEGGGSPGRTRKCIFGCGFNPGLDGENENEMGNAFVGLRRSACDRGRRTTAACGTAETTRSRERKKAGGKRGNGWRASLPHGGAPAVACGGKEVAERRRDERPNLGDGGRQRGTVH
jgi:hypothetical protein